MADVNACTVRHAVVRRKRKKRLLFTTRKKKTRVNSAVVDQAGQVVAIPSTSLNTSQPICSNSITSSGKKANSDFSTESIDNDSISVKTIIPAPPVINIDESTVSADTQDKGKEPGRTVEASTSSEANEGDRNEFECPICLETCVFPAKLPCSHIFCYLCLKGTTSLKGLCPMCRAPIPYHFSTNPELLPLETSEEPDNEQVDMDVVQTEEVAWFYEGRNGGWWQFENRMSDEIEQNQRCGITRFDMMICGELYVIDTMSNIQYCKDHPRKMRKLLRDLPSRVNKKGIAGISSHKLPSCSSPTKNNCS